MTGWSHSTFLDSAPNASIDHRYLAKDEIAGLAVGVYFKKKDRLTRHRFAKFELADSARQLIGEAVDDRGHWRMEADELARVGRAAGITQSDHERILEQLGLAGLVLPPNAGLPAGEVRPPESPDDIERLYADYTDMHAQGHFDADSPDLDRLQLLTSWVSAGTRILDLGCNSGAFGERLIPKGCEVHGVDLSGPLVAAACARGVVAIKCWAENTPYASGMFDAVICAELLEHALDPNAILREARRVMRNGGLLIGSIPHASGPWGHEDIGYHPEHLWALEQTDLERMLVESAFAPIEFRVLNHGMPGPVGLAFRAEAV